MESNNRNDMPAFMDTDLDPYTLVHDIVSNWWVIILGAIAGALLTYVVVSSRYVPEYTTQATFVVASRGDANAYSNLSSANTMAKTFEKILKSNIMEKKICEKLKVEELDADIHAKVLEGTNMLVLSVTADTPKDSIDIIRTVMDNYSSVSLYTVGSAVMDVLEEPKVPYTPDNPLDAGGQAKKGGLVAGALVLILLGMFSYMKNTIKQENEIEKKLDARSLGAISYEWKYKTIRDIFRRKKKAILVDDPVASFRFVESYKKLAAKVEYRMAKNEQKVLVVTSVSENEGKSTVAANLAITLAEQSKRVLLVEGDSPETTGVRTVRLVRNESPRSRPRRTVPKRRAYSANSIGRASSSAAPLPLFPAMPSLLPTPFTEKPTELQASGFSAKRPSVISKFTAKRNGRRRAPQRFISSRTRPASKKHVIRSL